MTCQNTNCEKENYQRRKILRQMYHLLEEMENQSYQPRSGFPFNFLEMVIDKVLLSFEHFAELLTDQILAKLKRFQRKEAK